MVFRSQLGTFADTPEPVRTVERAITERLVGRRGTARPPSREQRRARWLCLGLLLLCFIGSERALAAQITYTYDDAGRLKAEAYDDGASVSYTLDAAGNRKNVTTTAQMPIAAPSIQSVSPTSATGMTVSWSKPTGGNGTYTYNIYRAGVLLTQHPTTTTATDSGLTAHTSYSYTVSATDSDGNTSQPSTALSNYTYANPTISSLTASTVSATAITINWAASDTNGPGLSGFTLLRSDKGSTPIASPGATATSYNDTGLTSGTSYTYTLNAIDTSGDKTTSTATGGTYPLPSITSFTAVAASSTSMTLTWTASDSGGPGGLTYSVTRNGTSVSGCTTSPCTDTGLAPGTSYTYVLTADDSKNDPSTATANGLTAPGAPGTPTFSAVTATTATVNWSAGGGTVTSYSYSLNSGSWISTGTAQSVALTGLNPGSNNSVQVIAVNAGGNSPVSTASFWTVPTAPGAPTFSAVTATTATVNWGAATGTVTSYLYSINSGTWISTGTTQSVALTGLSPGSNNTVQVMAVNAGGNSSVSTGSFLTVPSAPGAPTFSSVATTTATASWGAATGTVTSYSYSLNSGAWINTGTAQSVNLTGLIGGTNYTVQVLATNAGGNGAASSGSFTTNSSYTDTPVMTQGSNMATENGFNTLGADPIGSMSPATTTNGHTYVQFFDKLKALNGAYQSTLFSVSGFSADPGQVWLTSAGCNVTTQLGSTATYSYLSGTSTWTWTTGKSFGQAGNVNCTIVHK
jgi:YD repeat-containing protein